MSIEKIERLEELITLTLEVLSNLHAEKSSLEQQVQELEKEKQAALKENKEAKGSLEKLKQLKVSHHKLEKDRASVRLKVQNALQKIEKMDFQKIAFSRPLMLEKIVNKLAILLAKYV